MTALGLWFICFGVIAILFGHKVIEPKYKGGTVTKLISAPAWWPPILKWMIGAAAIAMGIFALSMGKF